MNRLTIEEARQTYPREMQAIDVRVAEIRAATGSDCTLMYAEVLDGQSSLMTVVRCDLDMGDEGHSRPVQSMYIPTPIRPKLRVVS